MGELDLTRARPEESGFYICVGVDPAGNSANTTFRIDVEGEGARKRGEDLSGGRCIDAHDPIPTPHQLEGRGSEEEIYQSGLLLLNRLTFKGLCNVYDSLVAQPIHPSTGIDDTATSVS